MRDADAPSNAPSSLLYTQVPLRDSVLKPFDAEKDGDKLEYYSKLGCVIEEGAQEMPGALLFPTNNDTESPTIDTAKVLDVHVSPDTTMFIKVSPRGTEVVM